MYVMKITGDCKDLIKCTENQNEDVNIVVKLFIFINPKQYIIFMSCKSINLDKD